jgi:hypothetical protein
MLQVYRNYYFYRMLEFLLAGNLTIFKILHINNIWLCNSAFHILASKLNSPVFNFKGQKASICRKKKLCLMEIFR